MRMRITMNQTPALWPVAGYEDAPARKRLAYFRPWIEDKTVRLWPGDLVAEAYVRALAVEVVESGEADLVFAPGVKAGELASALEEAQKSGAAFVGWSTETVNLEIEAWHQEEVWPFNLQLGADDAPIYVLPGKLDPIAHASIGLTIPTHSHPRAAVEAIATMAAEYPGRTNFVLVANGVEKAGLDMLKSIASDHPDRIELKILKENEGYGRGCNAGLAQLTQSSTDFAGVMNDDVLPGVDCLYEMVYAFRQLEALGHAPGAIGPVSNEINGGQRVELDSFENVSEMKRLARDYWHENRSTANQTLQLRGLLLLWSRECLDAVGGFDPRFGMGNFEDDDHNLRTRLSGYTLWIAGGAFLFHHGSSTFRSIKLDYEANIRRNSEAMIRKWGLDRLEEWVALETAPAGVPLHVPFDAEPAGPSVKINGEAVDLIHQASDIEFAAWIMHQTTSRTVEGRKALIELVTGAAAAA